MNKIKVMLTTEGTYPFHQGGVSTWCDALIKNCNKIDFTVYSITMNPFITKKFTLPENANMIQVPLWGTEEPSEHLNLPFSKVFLDKKNTTNDVIDTQFIDCFSNLIIEILNLKKDPEKFADILLNLFKYFSKYEYKKSFKSETTWETYKTILIDFTKNKDNKVQNPDVFGLISSLGWIYRFLNVINTPIPRTNVCHSSAAAFCGVPCVISKKIYKSSFLLTEHGVYMREQYLSLSKRLYSSFLSTFLIRFINSITSLNYYFADQISPVCEYNTRWEKKMGVKDEKIKVIYNGVDNSAFKPDYVNNKLNEIIITMVARIDPIKDIKMFIKAAAVVKAENIVSNSNMKVKFLLYGSVSVDEYYNECLEVRKEYNLINDFIFKGHTSDVPSVYKNCNVVVLSSISEAFPYSVIEAMMSGKPVVATDVGGVREALGDTGIVVMPGDIKELANGILKLIKNSKLRISLGEEARERALTNFTIDKIMTIYYKYYINLAVGQKLSIKSKKIDINLVLRKAYASYYSLLYEEALKYFNIILIEFPKSIWTPVIHFEKAKIYGIINMNDKKISEIKMAKRKIQNIKGA
ncbi:MAG: GT4 family glycosyltransferase PelF [Clostridiales bacterium]